MQTFLGVQAVVHFGKVAVGIFGRAPGILNCVGTGIDAALLLSERLRESDSARFATLAVSERAYEQIGAVAPDIELMVSTVRPPFKRGAAQLKKLTKMCSSKFQRDVLALLDSRRAEQSNHVEQGSHPSRDGTSASVDRVVNESMLSASRKKAMEADVASSPFAGVSPALGSMMIIVKWAFLFSVYKHSAAETSAANSGLPLHHGGAVLA